MALGAPYVSTETEEILRETFKKKGWEFSRPVLFPASRSNLVVTRDGEKIDTLSVFETKTNMWSWNMFYPPMTVSCVLVSDQFDSPEIYVIPSQALITLGEENARKWELQDPTERSRESNHGRVVWRDQIQAWLI